jgi:membrane-associated phospholipid phosphatase
MKTSPKTESASVVRTDFANQTAWKSLTAAGRQHYAHPIPTLLLAALVPVYFIINAITSGRTVFVPELALDRAVPLEPVWILVYSSMWVFAFLPAFVIREVELRRRAVLAYITVALVSYVGFLLYPTMGPRPARVIDEGFFAWSLRFIYDSDRPYNCFPSLHVAYAFVAALTCYRIHRGLGIAALAYASLIGISTLYIKQHYVIDVVAGALSAYLAYLVFLRPYPRDAVAAADRRRAPLRVLPAIGVFGVLVAVFWVAYNLR